MTYAEFIESKERRHSAAGFDLPAGKVHKTLFPFQNWCTRRSLKIGRSALFAGTGMGKTGMSGEWNRQIEKKIGGRGLIVAPLAVAEQSIPEIEKLLGYGIHRVHSAGDIRDTGTHIVNYDRLGVCEGFDFNRVTLDESSIIKSHDGKTYDYLKNRFRTTPYKLCCTATPSPNDYMELATHAEFLGVMTRQEMLATFFIHDGGETSKWRLKKHAVSDFWKWVSSWATVLNHPRDIGFEQDGYDLPELRIHDRIVEVESTVVGGLFGTGKVSATKLHSVLRESAPARVQLVADLVRADPGGWLIWVNSDLEQDLIEKALPGINSVRGKTKESEKADRLLGFGTGKYPDLTTKGSIGGWGMNFQSTRKQIHCGVTFSWEEIYQKIRRQWRYGQTEPVDCYMITCNAQESVKAALKAKEELQINMATEMRKYCTQGMEL